MKYNGVQRVYCNLFPAKSFYGSHRLDPVMIRPPGLDHGAFVVSPDSVWYAQVLLLFSATSQTDTGSKTFECALVSTLETYDDPEHGTYCHYCHYWQYCEMFLLVVIIAINVLIALIGIIKVGWIRLVLESYMSSTTRTRFYTSYQLNLSWVNCRLCQ